MSGGPSHIALEVDLLGQREFTFLISVRTSRWLFLEWPYKFILLSKLQEFPYTPSSPTLSSRHLFYFCHSDGCNMVSIVLKYISLITSKFENLFIFSLAVEASLSIYCLFIYFAQFSVACHYLFLSDLLEPLKYWVFHCFDHNQQEEVYVISQPTHIIYNI